jgi:predicted enzyme related to lactoylglutathione lyase
MTCHPVALCFDANDPLRLARFWGGVLGWEMAEDPQDGIALLPGGDTGFGMRFLPTQEQKTGQNQMHFDLTSTSLEDQQQTVARSLRLGALHIDIGQRPEEGHVVLADPEGNEFCVIEPGNNFLADCGFIGALACDGSQEVGYFWSAALAWPKNRLHFDIAPPLDGDQQAEVDNLVSLGATRIDIGQGEVSWVVTADPDGHEFCVLKAG